MTEIVKEMQDGAARQGCRPQGQDPAAVARRLGLALSEVEVRQPGPAWRGAHPRDF